jgi:hypothetical protein
MNIKSILKLFGLDVKKPLDFLLKLLVLVDDEKLTRDVEKAMCLNMTDKRKLEIAAKLKLAAEHLEAKDCGAFAKVFVEILKGIKF